MSKFQTLIKEKQSRYKQDGIKEVFKDENGAIDLASIMVGVIVIGLIGGVIAATVFAVIPWTQDNAAKQQLDSIVQAENAYFGLSAADPSPLPAGYKTNSFGNSAELANAKLLTTGQRYCATTPADGKSYTGYSQSSSGTIFTVTDKNSKPEVLIIPAGTKAVDSLPSDCQFITVGMTEPANAPSPTPTPPAPYVDPTPTITKLTFRCDTTRAAYVPMSYMNGVLTWNDTPSKTYTGSGLPTISRTLNARQPYTLTLDGTYKGINANIGTSNPCLRSVDHMGSATGVTTAWRAFEDTPNLVSVPEHIPSTLTDMNSMFKNNASFNSSNISNWDVSNVTNMNNMFNGATSFNQPLNNWNVEKVTDTSFMFNNATSFNQPLNNWKVSNVGNMIFMFNGANAFSQDLGDWDTSNVESMAFMFGEPYTMKNNITHNTNNITTSMTLKCDTAGSGKAPISGTKNGTLTWSDGTSDKYINNGSTPTNSKSILAGQTITVVFEGTYTAMLTGSTMKSCWRSVDHWGSDTGVVSAYMAFEGATNLTDTPSQIPSTITDTQRMFFGASSFNDADVKNWDVSKVTNMANMFNGAAAFNQDINSWDVSKVTDMSYMFQDAASFNQPLNNWNTSSSGTMVFMFNRANAFNQDLGSWNTNNVKSMAYMFGLPHDMKNNINYTTAPMTISMTFKCDTSAAAYIPMNGGTNGTLTWNDGTLGKYNTNGSMNSKPLTAGVTYTVTFEGTFQSMTGGGTTNPCLRSVDVWGPNTGTTSARMAFRGASNLTSVPASIPKTITDMSYMFQNATSFNDPNVTQWDVSKVTNMSSMFSGATSFNQDLSDWNTAALTTTNGTFFAPVSFPDDYMPAKTTK